MDENVNPNVVPSRNSGTLSKTSELPVPDGDAALISAIAALEDGGLALVGDLVLTRAGLGTYHPLKACQGLGSPTDLVLVSALCRAPAPGEESAAVRSTLRQALLRTPRRLAQAAAGGTGATTSPQAHLHAACPFAHARVIDSSLIRSVPASRAREVLAGLTPLPARQRDVPTVVVAVHDDRDCHHGMCYLGQKMGPHGYSAFTVHKLSHSGPLPGGGGGAGPAPAVAVPSLEELLEDYHDEAGPGPPPRVTARALYDLWGTAGGDVIAGSIEAGDGAVPFVQLAGEWDMGRLHGARAAAALGCPPPPVCAALLVVGGACPLTPASLALRADLTQLAGMIEAVRSGRGYDATTVSASSRDRCQQQWDASLEALLSGGSERVAEASLAAAASGAEGKAARTSSEKTTGPTPLQDGAATDVIQDDDIQQAAPDHHGAGGGSVGAGAGGGQLGRHGDLDFCERLWETVAAAPSPDDARSAIVWAFACVGEGRVFPVVHHGNATAIGAHVREGVAIARAARYWQGGAGPGPGLGPMGTGSSADGGGGGGDDLGDLDRRRRAWRDKGAAMLRDPEGVALACLELGVHKTQRDACHWFEVEAGVTAPELAWFLSPAAAAAGAVVDTLERQVRRLEALLDAADLVALAQAHGAPRRQGRALFHAALQLHVGAGAGGSLGPGATAASEGSDALFALGLPEPMPGRARAKLSSPLFWELLLSPPQAEAAAAAAGVVTANGRCGGGGGDGGGVTTTVSHLLVNPAAFRATPQGQPLAREALRRAQGALRGCKSAAASGVLSCIAGVETPAELVSLLRQPEEPGPTADPGSEATSSGADSCSAGAGEENDAADMKMAATAARAFVCIHRHTSWEQ